MGTFSIGGSAITGLGDVPGLYGGQVVGGSAALRASLNPGSSPAGAGQLTAAQTADPQTSLAVNQLLSGAAAQSTRDAAQGQAQGIIAQGDAQEADAYASAGEAANSNARLARVSASIQGAQEDRTIYKAIGGQQADIAAAGFGPGGSALYLAADSARQGALAQQLISTQGEITAGGYEGQAAAAAAEEAAARAAGSAASVLGSSSSSVANQLRTNAASQGALLQANSLNSAMTTASSRASGGVNFRAVTDPSIARNDAAAQRQNAADDRAWSATQSTLDPNTASGFREPTAAPPGRYSNSTNAGPIGAVSRNTGSGQAVTPGLNSGGSSDPGSSNPRFSSSGDSGGGGDFNSADGNSDSGGGDTLDTAVE